MARWPGQAEATPLTVFAVLAGVVASMVLATVLSGGQPVALALLALVLLLWTLQAPLVAVPPLVLAQVIWLVGGYAPGGVNLLTPSKLTLGLLLAGWLGWAWRDRVALTWAPHMGALAAFFLVVLLGPVLTPAFDDSLVGIGKYGLMFLPYLLLANVAVERRGIVLTVGSIIAVATLAALLALVERFLPGISLEFEGVSLGAHLDDQSISGVAIKRVTGGIGDANWFSYTMATTLPLCLYGVRAARSGWLKAACVAAALLQTAGIVLSYTRTPMMGLAGALLFLVWQRRIAVMPLLVAAAIALVSAPAWLPAGFLDRFFSSKYASEGSTPIRREIFDMALELIQAKPLLGHGYQQYGPQFIERSRTEMGWEWERRDVTGEEPAHLLRAHNLYLDVWVQHGLLGLVPLLLAFAMMVRELLAVARAAVDESEADLALCLCAGLISFLLCGLGGHSQELKILWMFAGLAAGLRRWVLSGHADPRGSAERR